MSEAQNIDGAAEKISGLLNPKDQQETETKAEPSESKPETQEVQESQVDICSNKGNSYCCMMSM